MRVIHGWVRIIYSLSIDDRIDYCNRDYNK